MNNDEYEDEVDKISDNSFVNFYYNNKILVWIFIGIIIFILLMVLLTRGGTEKKEKITYDIKINQDGEVYVNIGSSVKLTATVTNDPRAEVMWSIDNNDVAKVDNGNVTGLDYGNTLVTATYIDTENNKYTDTLKIIVVDGDSNVSLTDVSFKEGDLFMPLNDTYKIALILTPSNGCINNETFVSSNTSIVTVDNKGLVTAVGEGNATITFDVNNGLFRKSLNVYVDRSYPKKEIIITPDKISLDGELRKIAIGGNEKLTYMIKPQNADTNRLIWTSSDESIVTVDNGIIKGIKEGRAIITVKGLNGESDRIDVEVEKDIIEVSDIELDDTDFTLKVGESLTIKPRIIPTDASNKVLSYTSTNDYVAFADPNETGTKAMITGLREGNTTIIIESTNNIKRRLNIKVTDNKPKITSSPRPTATPYIDYSSGSSSNYSSSSSSSLGYRYVSPTPKPTLEPTISISCTSSVKVGDYIDCRASNLVSGDSIRDWVICDTRYSTSSLTKTIRATKEGTCYARVYTNQNATAYTKIIITSSPTPQPTLKPTVKPTVSIMCTSSAKVGDYIDCKASNLVSGDSVKEWVICNTSFNANGLTKTVRATKAGTCTAMVYTNSGAQASTTISIANTTMPTPTAKPTVSIKCTPSVKVGDNFDCSASNLVSGDSVKEWVICNTSFAGNGLTKTVRATKAGTCTAMVNTNRGASASTTITITNKTMSDLTYICKMGELTIKDGTKELDWRTYCIRENKSSANYERFFYICTGKGSYTGEYSKTCSM